MKLAAVPVTLASLTFGCATPVEHAKPAGEQDKAPILSPTQVPAEVDPPPSDPAPG